MSKKITTVADVKDRCRMGEGGCWEWAGAMTRDKHPIPIAKIGPGTRSVGNFVFEMAVRPLIPTEIVWRTCREPRCVNPNHLMAGTRVQWGAWVAGKGIWRGNVERSIKCRLAKKDSQKLTQEALASAMATTNSQREAAKVLGVSQQTVSRAISRHKLANGSSVFSWRPHGQGEGRA